MPEQTQFLFFILLLLALGAVIAFSYFVIKPAQAFWAIKRARRIVASGEINSRWQFENVYRILATTRHDLEAAYLWQKLQQLKESAPPTSKAR